VSTGANSLPFPSPSSPACAGGRQRRSDAVVIAALGSLLTWVVRARAKQAAIMTGLIEPGFASGLSSENAGIPIFKALPLKGGHCPGTDHASRVAERRRFIRTYRLLAICARTGSFTLVPDGVGDDPAARLELDRYSRRSWRPTRLSSRDERCGTERG
jgi:hypothetical protein